MKRYLAKLLILGATTSMAIALPVAVAAPAHADDCQPEELVLGSGNSPYNDENSPLCPVMRGIVYPTLQCADGTTLIGCVNEYSPVPVTNPIPATGPINDQVARYVYCTFVTVADGGETLLCRQYMA